MMAAPCLVLGDRIDLEVGLRCVPGVSVAVLAATLGVAVSTVYRELARNGGRERYRADTAHARAVRCRARPKPSLRAGSALGDRIAGELAELRSPVGISLRLRAEGITGPCPETIYQAIYAGRLGVDPTVVLHTRRRRRYGAHTPSTTNPKGHYLGDFARISTRPVRNDGETGHWEGDLITGVGARTHLITLIETTSKYTVLLPTPEGTKRTKHVVAALAAWASALPPDKARSLTWDRGSELTNWPDLTDLFTQGVYFCDARSPWQRPTSEQNNGHIRNWFPRTGPMTDPNGTRSHHAMHILNTEPRRSLNGHTPHDTYHHPPLH